MVKAPQPLKRSNSLHGGVVRGIDAARPRRAHDAPVVIAQDGAPGTKARTVGEARVDVQLLPTMLGSLPDGRGARAGSISP